MKIVSIVAISLIILTSASSCMKSEIIKQEQQAVSQTVNVTLKQNESYTYTLPLNTTDDQWGITTQAAHDLKSELQTTASAITGYAYTPAKDYVGTDQVVISTIEEHHSHHRESCHGGQSMNHQDEADMRMTINFTIVKDATTNNLKVAVK